MRLLWLLSLRLAATRADTCAATTAQIQGQTCNATSLWVLGCFPSFEGVACAPSVDGVAFAAPRLVVRGSNVHVVDVDDALHGLWIHNGAPSLGTNETESAAAIRARLSGRCRADRDEACENCYSPHMSTLCPFSLTARAAAVETGVELVLTPSNGEALRWVLPRHARPPWRLPQHAPLR